MAMLTLTPLVAVTLGECEKKCCRRGAKAHACCKRTSAVAPGVTATRETRCPGGHASVGLGRLEELAAPAPMAGMARLAEESGALVLAETVGYTVEPGHSPFSQRPPPFLS